MNSKPHETLIVALDVDSADKALDLVGQLNQIAGMFKVGSQLFTVEGPDIVRRVVNAGARVFLDLKFHDIPNTVASAAVAATRLGVAMLNVHAAGGPEMMSRTADAVSELAEKEGIERPWLIAVTVLTSTDAATLKQIGVTDSLEHHVTHLAKLAAASGMDGVVASPLELTLIRQNVSNPQFLVVTPGIRPASASLADQKRVTTPAEAVKAGANYIVVGRPITAAPIPLKAAQEIVAEMS